MTDLENQPGLGQASIPCVYWVVQCTQNFHRQLPVENHHLPAQKLKKNRRGYAGWAFAVSLA